MNTKTEEDFFKLGRQLALALDRGEPLTAELKAYVDHAGLGNPDLPSNFVAESLASLSEPRKEATPFVPRSVQDLVSQVEILVAEFGAPQNFDAAQWVAQWLEQPLPALGNAKPAEFLRTAAGRELLAGLLARMQSSAFS